MNKKAILFFFLILLSLGFVFSADNSTCIGDEATCKVDNAYSCLKDKINEKKCSNLPSDDKVFSFLSTGLCKTEAKSDSKFKSDVKYTSEVLLGLGKSGSDSNNVKEWLISQNRTATGIDWFLQIESTKATTCTVKYGTSSTSTVSINEDKKITSLSGGNCFTLSEGDYWLSVNQNCYAQDFEISCDQQFLTTLLYKKQSSDTVYVSDETHSSSQSGTTREKVDSFCFKKGVSCDYESTLWASLALNSVSENVSSYLPYLVVMAEDNKNLLPESFLYHLTGNADFKNQLLSKQINNKWWLSSNDRYYGTAQALNPLKYEESSQKSSSVDWLLNEAQGEDGCWDSGNIKNTGFLLYSIWPRTISSTESNQSNLIDCVSSGYFCMSQINCAGQVLSSYSCSGAFVCCSQSNPIQTCSEQGGKICSSSEFCNGIGSLSVGASDITSDQKCCLSGTCQSASATSSSCESFGGTCRVSGCLTGETKSSDSCDFASDYCCVASTTPTSVSYFWTIFLIILIALVVLGIIFREKLRILLFRLKSGFKGGESSTSNSRGPPRFPPPSQAPFRPLQRRIIPGTRNSPMPRARSQSEIDEVLKKLREIGK